MRALRIVPLLALAAACAPEFTPRSTVADLRVLAVNAWPLEAGPSDTVTLDAVRLPPPGATILEGTETWTFCPFSIGSSAAYECAVSACEFPVHPSGAPAATPWSSAPVTASPHALLLDCLAILYGGTAPAEIPPEVPDVLGAVFRYVVEASDGSTRETVQRLPLHTRADPVARNAPPGIDTVSIDGVAVAPEAAPVKTLTAGGELEVRVVLTPGSAQDYEEGGRPLVEQLVVSFYTTAGRYDYDWANGPDAAVKLQGKELTAETNAADVWVVARDLRGGETARGPYHVTVDPAPPPPRLP